MDDYPYTLNYPFVCELFWYKNVTMKPTDNLPCHLSMCCKSEQTDGLSILNNNNNNDVNNNNNNNNDVNNNNNNNNNDNDNDNDNNNNSNNKYPLGIMYKDKLNILFIQTDSR